MSYQFARIVSDRNNSFLSQILGFWHLDSAEEDPPQSSLHSELPCGVFGTLWAGDLGQSVTPQGRSYPVE